MVFAGTVPPEGGAPCGRYPLIWVQNITWSGSEKIKAELRVSFAPRNTKADEQHSSAAKRPAEPTGTCDVHQEEQQNRNAAMILRIPVLPFFIFNLINNNMKIKNVRPARPPQSRSRVLVRTNKLATLSNICLKSVCCSQF